MKFFCSGPERSATAFARMRSKSYHIVGISVLFALLLWFSINMGEEYQVTLQVPLVVENVPAGKAFRHSIPKSLSVKMRGTGWRLASFLFSGESQCILNFASLGSSNAIVTDKELADYLTLSGGIKPVDVNPDTLILDLDQYGEKKVPVNVNVVLEFHDNYGLVGAVSVKPESVVVGGAQSILQGVHGWQTVRQTFADLRESFTVEFSLVEPTDYSLQLFQKNVQFSANIQPFAEKTFSGVPIKIVASPPDREVIFIPPKIDVVARGAIDQLAALSNVDFRLSVDYQLLAGDTTGYVQPHFEYPPAVRVIVKRPERLQYIIRKRL